MAVTGWTAGPPRFEPLAQLGRCRAEERVAAARRRAATEYATGGTA
ncbi:MAG TPA: hypothetical protein VK425_07155 [Acidimicrobiales bacterium]|nr:hypothetical protein [Acidimicrobiales bacterium]